MMRETREKDTKTLRYDWFLSDDVTECEVREGYVDADALIEHAHNVAEARDKLFREFAYDHEMTLYGEPSPALAGLMEQLAGVVPFRRFSLLQGLHVDIEARRGPRIGQRTSPEGVVPVNETHVTQTALPEATPSRRTLFPLLGMDRGPRHRDRDRSAARSARWPCWALGNRPSGPIAPSATGAT